MAALLAGCGGTAQGGGSHQASSSSQKGSSQQTSEPTTNETSGGSSSLQTTEPTKNETSGGRCADNANASVQQGKASGGEVSNGKIVFERENADDNADIYVIDEEGTHETRLTRTPQEEGGPVWSPDREQIAFSRSQSSIYVMDADGANKTRLTVGHPEYPVWSPDGRKLAFITKGEKSDGLSVMNADGTNRTQFQLKLFTPSDTSVGDETYKTTLPIGSLVWSPTSNKLAFGSYTESEPVSYSTADASASAGGPVEGSSGIYLINVDGTGLCKLTGSHEQESYGMTPAWSPDGRKIAFADNGMINVINPDGSGLKKLTGTEGAQYAPVWSPDGQKIAYDDEDNSGLFVINADGSGQEKLAVGVLGLPQHAWSPDGQKIAFLRTEHFAAFTRGELWMGDASLCAINADGTELSQLARDSVFHSN
jgi:TolB protein